MKSNYELLGLLMTLALVFYIRPLFSAFFPICSEDRKRYIRPIFLRIKDQHCVHSLSINNKIFPEFLFDGFELNDPI